MEDEKAAAPEVYYIGEDEPAEYHIDEDDAKKEEGWFGPYDGSFPAVGEKPENTGCTEAHQADLTVLPSHTRRDDKEERAERWKRIEKEAALFGIKPRRGRKWL